MTSRPLRIRVGAVACLLLTTFVLAVEGVSTNRPASADTDTTTLIGEGGTFIQPILDKLIADDTSTLAPLFASYTGAVDIDNGVADFIGTAPDTFNADFAVTERPLTTAEAATATKNGRSFAYVPFSATPVALATLVPYATFTSSSVIGPSDLCAHIPLTVDQLGEVLGYDPSDLLLAWNDPRIPDCQGGGALKGVQISDWANEDPTMENEALMTLLDSDATSKASFDAALTHAASGGLDCTNATPPTNCDAPSESWPLYPQNQVPGGDEAFLEKLVEINQQTNALTTNPSEWDFGAVFPISSVWTGDPLGVAWNIPTVALQNDADAFVPPSTGAAVAAQADASIDSNNLVTFNPSLTDATAYNNNMMLENYLVVPTNGLPADKSTALAQLIRFVLGGTGQADIESFGSAPATSNMVTAGLKIASQLDQDALNSNTSTSSTSTSSTTLAGTTSTTSSTVTTAPSSSTSTTGAESGAGATSTTLVGSSGSDTTSTTALSASSGVSDDASDGGSSDGASSSGSSGSLAFTGFDIWPLLTLGLAMVISAETVRLRLRRSAR